MTRTVFVRCLTSLAFGSSLLLGACVEDSKAMTTTSDPSGGSEGSGGSDTGVIDPGTTTGTDPTGGTSGSSEGGDATGCTFLNCDDQGTIGECSVWDQDCPDGQKCMPWDNMGGNSWNSTKCTPRDPNPAQPGDACTVEGSGVSGIDNCDVASMCWDVDGETNTGVCVAFCTGAEANPVCDDPQTSCSIANEGVLILCLPNCDPLSQDCPDGQACYGIDDGYVCAPDASGPTGAYGDPCEFLNACDPGFECLNADGVPGCQGALGCCSSFCDLDDPEASANCEGADGGQECTPAFEEGEAPPGYEAVGYCFIPA